MNHFGTTEPDSDPALQRVIVAARDQRARALLDRERAFEVLAATAFLAVAIPLALLVDSGRSFDLAVAVALVATYAVATRIEFRMGSGYTEASELVFIPMLFLLPTEAVPLFVAAALLLSRLPEYLNGEVHADRAALRIVDAWSAVGPAAVLVLAGATTPEWGDWPIYLGALAAQFGCDFLATTIRVRLGLGISLRTLIDELRAIYMVDALLAPIGILAAFAAAQEKWAFLLVLPLIALISIFARERRGRIDNALTLSSAYRGTAHLLGELLSTNHEYTGEHRRSVVVLAHQVAGALGLNELTMREVEFGALLHDVGKMAVPNELINKPGALSDEEWALMKTHTVEGEQMLDRIGGVLGEVGAVVRAHHERFDGTGYPDGLRGAEIPIASRVITVCDAFSAMTTERPYQGAMEVEAAIGELRALAGIQFDPDVVAAAIAVIQGWDRADDAGGFTESPPLELVSAER